jgi:hypothetical protein
MVSKLTTGKSATQPYFAGLSQNTFLLAFASLFADLSTEMLYPVLPVFLTHTLKATGSIVGLVDGVAQATPHKISCRAFPVPCRMSCGGQVIQGALKIGRQAAGGAGGEVLFQPFPPIAASSPSALRIGARSYTA